LEDRLRQAPLILFAVLTLSLLARADYAGVVGLYGTDGNSEQSTTYVSRCVGVAVGGCLITVAHCLEEKGEAMVWSLGAKRPKFVFVHRDNVRLRIPKQPPLGEFADIAVAALTEKLPGAYSMDILAENEVDNELESTAKETLHGLKKTAEAYVEKRLADSELARFRKSAYEFVLRHSEKGKPSVTVTRDYDTTKNGFTAYPVSAYRAPGVDEGVPAIANHARFNRGNSGSPLFVRDSEGRERIYGFLSTVLAGGSPKPKVDARLLLFTPVDPHRAWIQSAMAELKCL